VSSHTGIPIIQKAVLHLKINKFGRMTENKDFASFFESEKLKRIQFQAKKVACVVESVGSWTKKQLFCF